MSQYALEPLEHRMNTKPYREWPITEPTTRRIDVFVMPPKEAILWAAKYGGSVRLALRSDSHGDNHIDIGPSSIDEYRAINAGAAVQQRSSEWRANSPRYGSWRYYLADVALVRSIFTGAGWTMTPEEAALLAALDEYGRQAPVRYLRAV